MACRFERLPLAANDPYAAAPIPDAFFGIYDTVVAFDHLRHTLTVLAHDDAARPGEAARAIARVFAALDAPLPPLGGGSSTRPAMTANGTPAEFEDRVRRARQLIADGDCIQIVLSQRFDVTPAPDPLSLYRALRHVNPSPYMFLLETPAVTLVGASPEPFVRVEGGTVVMHPIAGTRPRGADEAEDSANEKELRSSEKERAEHVMLVDLARNDIGRVSRGGTVRVKELMRVDRFSHVMHLTSVVEGELAGGLDALDAFRACFPAGTVSGAPKIRAMERIAELEPDRRGPYAGAVGYLGFDGALDTCITIRTATIADGVCRIQAGAGIVADSDPAAEEAETELKAAAFLDAIRSPVPAGQMGSPLEKVGAFSSVRSPARRKVLLVDHEDSFVHTLAAYLRAAGGDVVTLRSGFTADELDEVAPELVVLSPGPGRPEDFGLFHTITLALERRLPVFGVCLGLQGIVEHFGGTLGTLSPPMHGKPSAIHVSQPGVVFAGLPQVFEAGRYHSLYALPALLPESLKVSALSSDGVIMGVQHESLPVAAVQFHPESIMTLGGEVGLRLVRNVVEKLL